MPVMMYRVRVAGTGWTGAPSLNTFYYSVGDNTLQTHVDQVYTRVQTGIEAMKDIWPSGVLHVVNHQVDVLDAINGEILETWVAAGADVSVTPGAGGVLSPPATAALIKMQTAVFDGGRRVLGRSFISPLRASHIDSGLLKSTGISAISSGVNAIKGTPGAAEPIWGVWHRPREAQTVTEHPPNGVTQRDGSFADVTTYTIPTKLAVLRSRRD